MREDARPRGPGISHFGQNPWYYPPDFPTKMREMREERHPCGMNSSVAAGVEFLCEHIFDVERFLGEVMEIFKPFQGFDLVDYDLRLVRACTAERSTFMTCVMALAPSRMEIVQEGPRQLRVALFFSLELFTGAHHIIRALKVPSQQDIRRLSRTVAVKFLKDLDARVPPEPTVSSWNNDAVLNEQSVRVLHNPVFPLSIGYQERN